MAEEARSKLGATTAVLTAVIGAVSAIVAAWITTGQVIKQSDTIIGQQEQQVESIERRVTTLSDQLSTLGQDEFGKVIELCSFKVNTPSKQTCTRADLLDIRRLPDYPKGAGVALVLLSQHEVDNYMTVSLSIDVNGVRTKVGHDSVNNGIPAGSISAPIAPGQKWGINISDGTKGTPEVMVLWFPFF